VDHEEDLETIASRILQPLDYALTYLAEGIEKECGRCAADGIDPAADPCTFAANVRRYVLHAMRAHLPLPVRAPMSPLHLDLGPYQLKILHADDGDAPSPRTDARREFYRLNELGVMSMNVYPATGSSLVVISEDVTEVLDSSLVLVWDYSGAELTQADLYRPPVTGFPGPSFDLLAATETVTEDDFSGVRREGTATAATGTDGGVSDGGGS